MFRVLRGGLIATVFFTAGCAQLIDGLAVMGDTVFLGKDPEQAINDRAEAGLRKTTTPQTPAPIQSAFLIPTNDGACSYKSSHSPSQFEGWRINWSGDCVNGLLSGAGQLTTYYLNRDGGRTLRIIDTIYVDGKSNSNNASSYNLETQEPLRSLKIKDLRDWTVYEGIA